MRTDYITINVYNNDNADIITEQGTIYTDKNGVNAWIRLANMKGFVEVAHKRYENGDETYWFN